MPDLTVEELQKAEEMPLSELAALAGKEPEEIKIDPKVNVTAETLDNSAETEEPEQVFRKEISNEDGSIDVYEAASLEELVDKIAEGKRQAVAQMKKVISEKRDIEAKTTQADKDASYVLEERLKKEPLKVIQEETRRVIEEEKAQAQRALDAQTAFVQAHPDYVANAVNGNRLMKEVQNLGYEEFTFEGLEKAFTNLKRDGLLQLGGGEASATTNAEGEEAQRTVETQPEAAQLRSPKKASTISTKNSRPATVRVQTGPTEDELYSMPLDKLKDLANRQLAERIAE